MLQAVPAPPTDPGPVASDLALTPRQPVGSGRRDHPPIADGQRPPQTAHRAGRWRSHRRRGWPAALPWRARGLAARLRSDMPKVFALPGRRREQPQPRAKRSTNDEPSEPLTAPMQTARPRGSRSSPAAAQRCAEGAGLDRDPRGRGTIGRAARCGDPTDPPTPSHHTTKMQAT